MNINDGKEKRKSRRVSFSRTQQVKEFQTGQNNLTLWNDTYEEEKSNASASNSVTNASASSNITNLSNNINPNTPGQTSVQPRIKQLQEMCLKIFMNIPKSMVFLHTTYTVSIFSLGVWLEGKNWFAF